jgi:hypothetical protein
VTGLPATSAVYSADAVADAAGSGVAAKRAPTRPAPSAPLAPSPVRDQSVAVFTRDSASGGGRERK